MKKSQRILAVVTTALLLATAGVTTYATAEEPSTPKEEVVYAKTDSSGDVRGIYVVNIYEGGDIVDYGDYNAVKNLSTTDEIHQSGDQITLTGGADEIYCEGDLNSKNLPWDITIGYTLDGKKVSPKELAGQDGALRIDLSFKQNTACDSSFFDRYALETTIKLNGKNCTDIVADDATVANVGEDKQLTYIMLPGKVKDVSITANVTDFEMESISINGLRMGLNIDIDDGELLSKVQQIEDAAAALDSGAAEAAQGATAIDNGVGEFNEKAYAIAAGSASLAANVDEFGAGIAKAQVGLNKLNGKSSELTLNSAEIKAALEAIDKELRMLTYSSEKVSELVAASATINDNLAALNNNMNSFQSTVGSSAYAQSRNSATALASSNANAAGDIDKNIATINGIISDIQGYETQLRAAGYGDDYDAYVSSLKGVASDLNSVKTNLNSNNSRLNATVANMNSYINGVQQKSRGVTNAAADLSSSYEEFNSNIIELADTLTVTISDMQDLATAINVLCQKYALFDKGLNEYTDGVAELVAGFDEAAASVTKLSAGSHNLAYYVNALYNGTETLKGYTAELSGGSNELAAGAATFHSATDGMDGQVSAEIDKMISSLTGGDGAIRSFVSDKNTKVSAVQFVIATDPIEIDDKEGDEAVAAEEEAEATAESGGNGGSFIDKFLNLFKN